MSCVIQAETIGYVSRVELISSLNILEALSYANFLVPGLNFSHHLIPKRKTIWTMLESNPASQLSKRARFPLCNCLSGK